MARDDPERPARRGSVLRGAWAGLMATAPMTVVLLVAQRLRLLDEPPPVRIVHHLLPGLDEATTRAVAGVAHAGYGAAGGAALALLAPAGRTRPAAAVGYGLLVYVLSYQGWVPLMGVLPPAHRDRRSRVLAVVAAHVVYGLGLARRGR